VVLVPAAAVGAVGVPVKAGDTERTTKPAVPVSSEITPANSAEVVAANCESLPVVRATLVIAPVPPLTEDTPVTAPVAPL
jgi:hypothetical protein